MSVNCDDIYRRTIPSLCPSVYTDGNCTSMYTKKITVEKEGMKKKWCVILQMALPTK
jgi:hypothetical protein